MLNIFTNFAGLSCERNNTVALFYDLKFSALFYDLKMLCEQVGF